MSLANANTSFQTALNRRVKAPCYLVELDGISQRYSTKVVQNPDPLKSVPLTYLLSPSLTGSQIRINEGSASLASFNFGLIDKDRSITKLLSENVMGNRKITVKSGFTDLDERFFMTVFVGRVFSFTLASDNLTWNFTCNSLYQDTQEQIFTATCKLTAPIGPADTVIYVDSTADFPAATAGVLYLRIDDEVMGYSSKTATSFTVVRENPTYSFSGMYTTAVAHSLGADANNFAVLQGNPIDLALQVLTSTGAGTNGPYDVLPACCGLAMNYLNIDITSFESQRDKWVMGYIYRIEAFEPTQGKTFLESEFFRFVGSYPVINSLGQLAIKVLSPPLPTQSMFVINDDNLEGAPTWSGNFGDKYFFNEIILQYDYDSINDRFNSILYFEDATSQTKYGIVRSMKMDSRALRTDVTGYPTIGNMMQRLLKRFANPSPIIQASVFSTGQVLQGGDTVLLSSAKIPDLVKGVMGVSNQLMEAIDLNLDTSTGRVKLTLNSTGYIYGHKYWAIGPAGLPVYSLATAAQRLYGFLSKRISAVQGMMSNGDDGYYITP